jgi:hypothetical protein
MNERIKQLAEQAGAVPAKQITNVPGDLVLVGEEEIQAFAELIVRECAYFSMVATDDHFDVETLYKHFGIKS